MLIVEDDPHYARVLCDLSRDKGFKVLVAMRGAEALALAREFHPTAVSLDVFLPDMLGWTVLNHLKQDPATRHIPVQMLTLDEDRQHGLARGAFAFVTKPTTPEGLGSCAVRASRNTAAPRRKRLLIVEDNPAEQLSISELLGHDDIEVSVVATGAEAIAAVHEQPFDCVVLDLRLPDMSGFEVLERMRDTPVARRIAGRGLHRQGTVAGGGCAAAHAGSQRGGQRMSSRRNGCWMKPRCFCTASSPIFRRRSSECSTVCTAPTKRWSARRCWWSTTTSATSSRFSSVLERRGMTVLTAGTGREAIAMLESTPDIAIVLMDIMMPEMDGYETMQVIRQNTSFRRLPIIALTAKAMKGDREKCLEAGASEYLAKPVNTEQLLSALRMWLHR